jgi:hypothetical protein|tara:strand:- start:1814 stop:2095 length:282 start_codon:yes stop_codon:yes gene_type:complete
MEITLEKYKYSFSFRHKTEEWETKLKKEINHETVFDIHCDFYNQMGLEVTNLGWFQDEESKIIESKVFIKEKPYVLKTIIEDSYLIHKLIKRA